MFQESTDLPWLTGKPVNYLICMTSDSFLQVIIILWCDHSCQFATHLCLPFFPRRSSRFSPSLTAHLYRRCDCMKLQRGESIPGATLMYRTECTEQQLWRWARERLEWEGVGVHYYNHFTSLEKVALKAGSVEETRTGEYVERGEERWAALMAVSKSKAQLHFSTFIAFSHEHPEHPHNNQRHFSSILASP